MNNNGHETRYSDSSFYDEVCVNCRATDAPGGGLGQPCSKPLDYGGITVSEWYKQQSQRAATPPEKEIHMLTGEDIEVVRQLLHEHRVRPLAGEPEDPRVTAARTNHETAIQEAQLAGSLANGVAMIQAAGAILSAVAGTGSPPTAALFEVTSQAANYLTAQFKDGVEALKKSREANCGQAT